MKDKIKILIPASLLEKKKVLGILVIEMKNKTLNFFWKKIDYIDDFRVGKDLLRHTKKVLTFIKLINLITSIYQNTIYKSEKQKPGENIYNIVQRIVLRVYKELLPMKQTNNLTEKWAKDFSKKEKTWMAKVK